MFHLMFLRIGVTVLAVASFVVCFFSAARLALDAADSASLGPGRIAAMC
jgi:hypothetical protein